MNASSTNGWLHNWLRTDREDRPSNKGSLLTREPNIAASVSWWQAKKKLATDFPFKHLILHVCKHLSSKTAIHKNCCISQVICLPDKAVCIQKKFCLFLLPVFRKDRAY